MLGWLFGRGRNRSDRENARRSKRVPARGFNVLLDGEPVAAVDISDGGICLSMNADAAPRQGVITILRGGRVEREVVAVRAWSRGSQVGYQFTTVPFTRVGNAAPQIGGGNERARRLFR